MTASQSLYRDGSITSKIVLGLAALAMVGLSLYLTQHYFNVKFPSSISEGSLCDINSFLNCDAATHSTLSNIMGVPISVFGMIIGLFTLCGFVFQNTKMEGSIFTLLAVNIVGCVVLFIYSLVVLGSLCPMCTLYYVASGLAFFLLFKFSTIRVPHILPLGSVGVVTLIIAGLFYSNVQGRSQVNNSLAQQLIEQYDALPKLGNPESPSPFWLAQTTENFADAPLQIVVFSDYQCPACRMLSTITHDIAKRYRGKINMQYVFYPLDHNCNSDITRPMNPLSCQGAYLTTCLPEKFEKVHDDIFANQDRLTLDWIQDYARREGVLECLNDPATKEQVTKIVDISKPFNINSTPSMLINGVKVVGVIPPNQLYSILDELVRRAEGR